MGSKSGGEKEWEEEDEEEEENEEDEDEEEEGLIPWPVRKDQDIYRSNMRI